MNGRVAVVVLIGLRAQDVLHGEAEGLERRVLADRDGLEVLEHALVVGQEPIHHSPEVPGAFNRFTHCTHVALQLCAGFKGAG